MFHNGCIIDLIKEVNMLTIKIGDIRREMASTINKVAYENERIILDRRGKEVAAIISIEDLKLLEKIEDYIDIHEAERLLADPMEKPIPYEQVRKELGFL
jgi:antitoxin Phd